MLPLLHRALSSPAREDRADWAPVLALALLSTLLLPAVRRAQAQTETVLYTFDCQTVGCFTRAGVALDSAGNLYGTTYSGGASGASGAGTVFKLTPSGTFTTLYSFKNESDGGYPYSGVVLDSKGNLYGTTVYGGAYGGGTVFKVTPSGTETVLHSFRVGPDGGHPYAGVVLDKGDLYGTTYLGGASGTGAVFKLSLSGTLTTLYSFKNGADGGFPYAGVVLDTKGNLYGTTLYGGASGFGTVFKLAPSGTETVLHSFAPNGQDGFSTQAGVILDSKGNLYGTTPLGGALGVGTVFEVTASGTETVLHSFTGGADGIFPYASLVFDKKGNLYGTTAYGGSLDLGGVFELTPSGVETVLHSFAPNGNGGYFPYAGLAFDESGNLYGTTYQGGSSTECINGCGVLFKVVP